MNVKVTIDEITKEIPLQELCSFLENLLKEKKFNTFLDVMASVHEFQDDSEDDEFWDAMQEYELDFAQTLIDEGYAVCELCD